MKTDKKLFGTADCFCLVFVSFLALYTRLWLIADPDCVTFDEVHFGNFSNWYINNRFHFDIHPPLGKMVMATIAKMTQYKGDIEYGSKFGLPYLHDELFFVSQRITPAIFSAFTSPLIYCACRCLQMSTMASACAGVILTCDISLIVEGKFILSDGVLHFFVMLHIFFLCHFLAKQTVASTIISGITLGAAAACKYTALGLVAVDGITQLVWMWLRRPKFLQIVQRATFILVPAIVTFLAAWYWHFIATPWDGYNSEYADQHFGSTILSKKGEKYAYWGNRIRGPSVFRRIVEWNIIMNGINMRSDIPHPYESEPIYWPLLLDRWVGFISMDGDREINCMGTPFVYWGVVLGLVLGALGFLFRRSDLVIALCMWGWAVSYVPFVLVPRTMFLYHYLVPLMFGVMNLVAIIERIVKPGYRWAALVTASILCFGCYIFFSPWCYGYHCKDCRYTRLWTDRWNSGPPKVINNYGIEMFNTTEKFADLPL